VSSGQDSPHEPSIRPISVNEIHKILTEAGIPSGEIRMQDLFDRVAVDVGRYHFTKAVIAFTESGVEFAPKPGNSFAFFCTGIRSA
jgi:hypothetical protein